MNVFIYSEPIELILGFIEENKSLGKIKTRMARAANCKLSYFSNVLTGKANLTMDQAFGLSRFMGLSEAETEFFLVLVQESRAGTFEFRQHLNFRMKDLRQTEFKLSRKLSKNEKLTIEQVKTYYSSWHYQAMHMLLTIPKFGRIENLADRLNLSLELILAKLKVLEQLGLAEKKGEYWKAVLKDIHIPIHDPSSLGNQIQWKMQSIQDLQNPNTDGLHYSAVHSLSLNDIQKMKAMIMEFIEQSRELVKSSQEEDIINFQIDFFKV
jgi:uncharacterized protein (TIGR02147 family)